MAPAMSSSMEIDNVGSIMRKVGSDGLTRSQRYYRNHPEVKTKNRERERLRRQRLKEEKQRAKVPPATESPKAEAAAPAQASCTTDGATSTTRHVAPSITAMEACPPLLASPFIHTSTSPPPTPAPIKPITSPSKKPRFPADFFSTRVYNREACYGEALNVLQEDRNIPRHRKGETLPEKVERLRNDALTWCCGWGGVAYWHVSLHETYTNACEEERPEEWEKELLEHAANGRHLLFQLTSTVELLAERPREPHKLRELLRLLTEMMQMVTMGITVLNMRCSILPSNVWRVERLYCGSSSEEEEGSSSSEEEIVGIQENYRDSDMLH